VALAVAWLAGQGSNSPDLLRPNFQEPNTGEVRRIPLLRTPVNKAIV
jgi:hypothetical protein